MSMQQTPRRPGTAPAPWAAASTGLEALKASTNNRPVEQVAEQDAPPTAKEQRAKERAQRKITGTFADHPHLLAMKPREGYLFRSDYYTVDDTTACILGFFHDEAARDDFGAFWGIGRVPNGLAEGVSVVVLEQVRRQGEKWIREKMSSTETLDKLDNGEADHSGTKQTRRKAAKTSSDIDEITNELADGASYLHVHNRLLIKAPSLEVLDDTVELIRRLYTDRFGTVQVAAYPGEQRPELTSLFRNNNRKRGSGEHFTSVEFAGSHSLVTNGLNDARGEYVGAMLGDVNSSAVLFDVNDYEHHVVIADAALNPVLNRAQVADMWGSKISQSGLISDARVVHLVLDNADLDTLGPRLEGLTARLDMNTGDINMFEMFGDIEDELSIFNAHLEKIVLMAEQAYETTDSDRSIIRGELTSTLTQFYIDRRMWVRNAKENRQKLRLVGLDHTHVPRLQDLVTYFDTKYTELSRSSARDDEALHAYNVLRLVFKNLLDNSGDLFNTHTAEAIDGVNEARRVIYDFSKLLRRGRGVAMAQLVNTIGFAVDSLTVGDTVILHGTEHIDTAVKRYVTTQLERLFARGGRAVFLYNDVDKMLDDTAFNRFDKADYTILGAMSDSTVARYQKQLAQDIPPDLGRLVASRGQSLAYLRRGVTNVVFQPDLSLGVNPARASQRAKVEEQVRRARAARAVTSQQPTRAERAPGRATNTAPRQQLRMPTPGTPSAGPRVMRPNR